MTSERARAYGRVMKTIEDVGPAKLHADEADRLREAADTLLFSEQLEDDARAALEGAAALAELLVEAGRWMPETAESLIRDLEACGPLAPVA